MSPLVVGEAARGFQTGHDGECSVTWSHVYLLTSVRFDSKYSYLFSVPLLAVFSIAMTVIKFDEGELLLSPIAPT